jgi:hypothetical protein
MISMLSGMRDHSRVYIDDLCTATSTFAKMLDALEAGWIALTASGFKLKPEKCVYARHKVTLLGWEIDGDGRRPDKSKMADLKAMALPTTVKELYSAIGLLNYYRNHIHRYAEKVVPLQRLLGPTTSALVLDDAAVTAWKTIIDELVGRFSLNHPTQGGLLRIFTDASNVALGAVLVEYPPGTDMNPLSNQPSPDGKVLAFCSKIFSATDCICCGTIPNLPLGTFPSGH